MVQDSDASMPAQPSRLPSRVDRNGSNRKEINPWVSLWSMIIGFFMILLDTTIVAVANPSIQEGLGVDVGTVLWVTSAYLLTLTVPMLIAGRLGDRFGQRTIYLIGLLVFTLSSLWCGLSSQLPGSHIGNLIAARSVQGIGAALISPQTMAVIQRIFPAARRGGAMAVWGTVAGVATMVGPVLGGFLVNSLGWEWIFFINVPVGVVALILGWRNIPKLQTHTHSFDWVGVALSAIAVFFLVFGVQSGNASHWSGWIIASIVFGVVMFALFFLWQARAEGEPLVPLNLFDDRNFSVSSAAIVFVGFAITSMSVPLYYYFQIVRGFDPTQSALMTLPSPILGIALAPISGRMIDRMHPRAIAVPGLLCSSLGLWLYAWIAQAQTAWGWLLIPSAFLGIGSAFMWGPLGAVSTRNLPPYLAGAASGVYNTARQLGSVIGSAAIATLVSARLEHYLPGVLQRFSGISAASTHMPLTEAARFTNAMRDSLIMPATALLLGALICVALVAPHVFAHEKQNARPC
jgi:EmrB/QacA subfamily drug resistance transporter